MTKVTRGQPITAALWNALPEELIQHFIENCIVSGPGIRFGRLAADRLSISADIPSIAGSDIISFQAIASGGGTGYAIIRVKKGTIADRSEGTGLTVSGKTGKPPAGWWEFRVSPGSEKYGVARVTLATNGSATAANFSLTASPQITGPGNSSTGAPPALAFRKLFKVTVDNDYNATVEQYAKGAQQCVVFTSSAGCTREVKNVMWFSG